MIGSEGTLGFIANITYNTVEHPPHRASSLIFYNSVEDASAAAAVLQNSAAEAAELMDAPSMRAGKKFLHELREIPDNLASLLVETRGYSPGMLFIWSSLYMSPSSER